MKRSAFILFMCLLTAVPGFAGILPDDHGNMPSDATVLTGPSNSISGVIEYDTDRDVFAFPFAPYRSYVIQVNSGTVRDVSLSIVPPGWGTAYQVSNTLWTAPLSVGFTNTGAAGSWALEVGGMFEYTTGSYNLAVWEAPSGQDLDGDGMTDSWEMDQFNSTTNKPGDDYDGDGLSNFDEFAAGTEANNAGSFVAIDSLRRFAGADVAGWQQAAFSVYRVYSATNVTGPWLYLDDHVSGDAGGLVTWTNGPGESDIRFYRVDFIY